MGKAAARNVLTCGQPRLKHLLAPVFFFIGLTVACIADDTPKHFVSPLSDTNKFPPPANPTTQQGYRLMMDLLGIKSLRPGANPNNPNWPTFLKWAGRHIKSTSFPEKKP